MFVSFPSAPRASAARALISDGLVLLWVGRWVVLGESSSVVKVFN